MGRPLVSRAQARAFDALAVETCGVASLVLMENAGRGATDVLVRELLGGDARGRKVAVVCGTGNNGGDGLVIARHLLVRGARPRVLLCGARERVSNETRANLEAWCGVGGSIEDLPAGAALDPLDEATLSACVVVDAVFGTGLDRPIEGWLGRVIDRMNGAAAPRFAVDLPSGLDANTGRALGCAVQAEVTATFAHGKLGLATPGGAKLAGRVHVVDIGVPSTLVERVGASAEWLEPEDLARWVAPRSPAAHKNAAGHVVVVAGSAGKVGAARLAAHGAMRAGAGLTTIATWPEVASALETDAREVMTARIDPAGSAESLDAILAHKQAVVIGPGLGLGPAARAALEHVLATFEGPMVVDADALTMLAGHLSAMRAKSRVILTPHPGELARLLETSVGEIEGDRFRAACKVASEWGVTVALKGAHTVIAAPDARTAVASIACPALATAGSGDALGGIIAALACAGAPFEATCAGVMLHALAGESWSRRYGGADRGLLASEIADEIPRLMASSRGRDAAGGVPGCPGA